MRIYQADLYEDNFQLYASSTVTTIDSLSDDYIASIDIREAFKSYFIEFAIVQDSLPDSILPQTCRVNLKNA